MRANDMDMQDKEFDKLFRLKLEDLEAEPSKKVWQGIAAELNESKPKKRGIIPFLSIAASIIVLIAAGVLFIPKSVKITGHHRPLKNDLAKVNRPTKINLVAVKPQLIERQKSELMAVNKIANTHHAQKQQIIVPDHKEDFIAKNDQPIVKENPPKVVGLLVKNNNTTQKTAIDSGAMANVVIKPTVTPQPEKAVLVAAIPVPDKSVVVPTVKKHRMRSFGDMLNVVIAAVDKRKDKIIEFSDTDGDEASITGVNLGIIKVKKEN